MTASLWISIGLAVTCFTLGLFMGALLGMGKDRDP